MKALAARTALLAWLNIALSTSVSSADVLSPLDSRLTSPSLVSLQSLASPETATLSDVECLKSEDIGCKSLWIYEFSKRESPTQRAFLLTDLASQLIQSGQRDAALSLLIDLEADADVRGAIDKGVAYDYAKFGRLFLELDEGQRAYWAFQKAVSVDDRIDGSLFEDHKIYAAKIGKTQGIDVLLSFATKVDKRFKSEVLQAAIDQLIDERSFDQSQEIIMSLPSTRQRAVNLASLAVATDRRGSSGMIDLAGIFDQISNPWERLDAYLGVAKRMIDLDEAPAAEALMSQIVYQNMTLRGASLDQLDRIWCEIARLDVKRTGVEVGEAWFSEISNDGLRDSCRFYAVNDLIESGSKDGLEYLAVSIDDKSLQKQTMSEVVEFFAEIDAAGAQTLLAKWESQHLFGKDDFLYGPAVASVAAALVRNGDVKQAVELVRLQPPSSMNRIVPSLVGALNKSGKGDIAEEFYLELSDDGRKARAFLHSM